MYEDNSKEKREKMRENIKCENKKKQKNEKEYKEKKTNGKYKYLILSCVLCFIIRMCSYLLLNVLEGGNNTYINILMNLENSDEHNKEINNELSMKDGEGTDFMEQNKKYKEMLLKFYQQNKRNTQFRHFFKNDSMHYSFNSDIYNLQYLYDSYVLSRLYKNVYHSLTVRMNPLLLKALHLLIFKKVRNVCNSFFQIVNNHELRYYLLITLVDIMIGIFLFFIVEHLAQWKWYFNKINCVNCNEGEEETQNNSKEEDETVVTENWKDLVDKQIRHRVNRGRVEDMSVGKNYERKWENEEQEKEEEEEEKENGKERDTSKDSDTNESVTTTPEKPWKLINPLLLINLYLNNPLTILSNAFLSLDNLKLLIITLSIYFTVKRINIYNQKIYSFFNLLTILFLNAILVYISSFHFILPIVGINYFIIYLEDDINTYHIKKGVHFWKIFRILVKNCILLIATLMVYVVLLLLSAHFNGNSLFFLNNTIINEYRIMHVLPNLGNFWYIFSLMFENVYSSYLFLFHFHIFIYAIPLMFRLMKTPVIYLQILEVIALMFHPNVTVNDMIFAMLLLSIDYKNTMCSTPVSKLIIIFLCHIGLYFVTVNLWLRKNTGNANYVFFNQIMVFNITIIIANNSVKRYVRLQTPVEQLKDAHRIRVSEESVKKNPLSNFLNKIFS